jgi:hypothetical protein
LGEVSDEDFFFVTVMAQERGEMTRATEEGHSSSGNESFLYFNNERPLVTVFGNELAERRFIRRCIEQDGEEDLLLHHLMILISEKPQEPEDGRHIGNFDPETILQLLEHSIDDVQPPAKKDVILQNKFYALHIFRAKKNASERALDMRAPGRRGPVSTTLYREDCSGKVGQRTQNTVAAELDHQQEGWVLKPVNELRECNSPPQLRRGVCDINKNYREATLSGADGVVLVNK